MYMKTFLLAALMIGSLYLYADFRNAEAAKHIYPASSGESVYIGTLKEPACVINAQPERTISEMSQDFGECLKIHKKYRNKMEMINEQNKIY